MFFDCANGSTLISAVADAAGDDTWNGSAGGRNEKKLSMSCAFWTVFVDGGGSVFVRRGKSKRSGCLVVKVENVSASQVGSCA